VKVIFLDFIKSSTVRTILVIYLIFFAIDKAHSIDVVFEDDTVLTNVNIGQLQNFDITTMRFIRFYNEEFAPFSLYTVNNADFRFYGQPGTVALAGTQLGGDLSSYTMLISAEINSTSSYRYQFNAWFLNFDPEAYPSPEQETDDDDDGSSFDINDLDYDLAAQFFASGFAIFILPWVTAYGYSSILRVIKES
jgi:hypothetical protein